MKKTLIVAFALLASGLLYGCMGTLPYRYVADGTKEWAEYYTEDSSGKRTYHYGSDHAVSVRNADGSMHYRPRDKDYRTVTKQMQKRHWNEEFWR